jgi:short-subunit dehydrogenase
MEDGSRRTALITGASAGIGLAFAREWAARGCDVVLTARRRERLDALAHTLNATYGVRAEIVAEDLADSHASERLVVATPARPGRSSGISCKCWW